MSNVLDSLCDILDKELERQENVLAVCRAQCDALRTRDVEYLQGNVGTLETLIREAAAAETARIEVLRRVVSEYELPEERQTLTGLIAVASEPWRARLAYFQKRLRETITETRSVLRENGRNIRQSLHVIDRCLGVLDLGLPAVGTHYSASGIEKPRKEHRPALIDQKG